MKVALCTMAKNEEDYLPEWIAYHRKLGFSEVFVYESGGWRYHGDGAVLEPVSSDTFQHTAFNKFITDHREAFDWVLFSDADEYVVLANGDNDIRGFLARYGDTKYLYVNWRMFGNDHQPFRGDYGVVGRFRKCNPSLDGLGKTFYNLRAGTSPMANAHAVKDYGNERSLAGCVPCTELGWIRNPDDALGLGYLAHYKPKTPQEWDRRMDTSCGLYFPFSQLKARKASYVSVNPPENHSVVDNRPFNFYTTGRF